MTLNNFGKFLVEDSRKIRTGDFLKKYRSNLKELILKSELEILGVKIHLKTSLTGNNGVRFWFQCPMCGRRIGVLFKHPIKSAIGCRKCLGLDYGKRRYKGMVEAAIRYPQAKGSR